MSEGMSRSPQVSIVIPAYNVGRDLLSACLDSVLSQSMGGLEVIVIDDGSTDETGAVADEYAQDDARVRVTHRANGGQASARNLGIEMARGEYVGFVDADDWVDPEMFSTLYALARANDADVCYSGARVVSGANVSRVIEQPLAGSVLRGEGEVARLRASFYGGLPGDDRCDPTPTFVWDAIYQRDVLDREAVRFVDLRFHEDGLFNIEFCRHAQTVVVSDAILYSYRKDSATTLTSSFSQAKVESMLWANRALSEQAQSEPENLRDECVLRAQRTVTSSARDLAFKATASLSGRERRRALGLICEDEDVSAALAAYPCDQLPLWERVVHQAMRDRRYAVLTFLAKIRNMMRR